MVTGKCYRSGSPGPESQLLNIYLHTTCHNLYGRYCHPLGLDEAIEAQERSGVGPGFDPSSRHFRGADKPSCPLKTEQRTQRLTPIQPTLTFSCCFVFDEEKQTVVGDPSHAEGL